MEEVMRMSPSELLYSYCQPGTKWSVKVMLEAMRMRLMTIHGLSEEQLPEALKAHNVSTSGKIAMARHKPVLPVIREEQEQENRRIVVDAIIKDENGEEIDHNSVKNVTYVNQMLKNVGVELKEGEVPILT
mmetsp:Transcript_14038/g.13648  ORF Transcript_14038/g.13648 Transcript_14038/m.13648 type:complete len:131 (-) Transcript_14038:136-528(-)